MKQTLITALVYDFSLGINGLLIKYNTEGKDDVILAGPEEAADLFRENGFISDYKVVDRSVTILQSGHPIPWHHFATEFNLTRKEAREIAELVEEKKAEGKVLRPVA